MAMYESWKAGETMTRGRKASWSVSAALSLCTGALRLRWLTADISLIKMKMQALWAEAEAPVATVKKRAKAHHRTQRTYLAAGVFPRTEVPRLASAHIRLICKPDSARIWEAPLARNAAVRPGSSRLRSPVITAHTSAALRPSR